MLRTLPQTCERGLLLRLAAVVAFTLLMIISAKVSIEFGGPVPFTLQVLVVLLSGMVLGARDGALSQLAYVVLIASGLPYDARGLGTVALFGPTGGYLLGFIAAAFVTGFFVERAGKRLWQRWLAGVVGIIVIYFYGMLMLYAYLNATLPDGYSFTGAWSAGVTPFIGLDLLKAFIAAGLTEGVRALINRQTS